MNYPMSCSRTHTEQDAVSTIVLSVDTIVEMYCFMN